MEVVNDSSSMLSNYEVLSLLQDIKAGRNGQKAPNRFLNQLATITYSTLKYLETTPCKLQSADVIAAYMKGLEPFNLKKAEKLQLLNHRPKREVEIQLIVEEIEERLTTEEQIEQLLELTEKCLPEEPSEVPSEQPEAS